jgi:uncharacterized protein (TIGR02996 family)
VAGIEPFVAAICAAPADDLPRLVFADWLDEHGESGWAQYIRTRVGAAAAADAKPFWRWAKADPIREAARGVVARWDPPLFAYLSAIDAQIEQEQERGDRAVAEFVSKGGHVTLANPTWVTNWVGVVDDMLRHQLRLPDLPGVEWGDTVRGFFGQLRASSVGTVKAHLPVAVAAAPVERVTVAGRENAAELADVPALRHVRVLAVGWLDRGGAERLARSPHLPALTSLHVAAGAITDAGLDALLRSDRLPALCAIGGPMISPAAIRCAADRQTYGRVVRVESSEVSRCAALAIGLGVWADAPLGDVGLARLAGCPEVGQPNLDLRSQDVGDEGLTALAQSPHLTEVRVLDLENNRIGPAGAVKLGISRHTAGLRRVDLSGNPIGDRGAAALAESAFFPNMERLILRECAIGDEGALAFARRPVPLALKALALQGNPIRQSAGAALRERFGSLVAF